MTKQQARQLVYRGIADSIEADISNGSEFLHTNEDGTDLSPADEARVREAAEELIASLRRRGKVPGW